MCAVTPSATPFPFPLFSCTYKLPNLQRLCFDNDTTVGGGGWVRLRDYPRQTLELTSQERLEAAQRLARGRMQPTLQNRSFIFNKLQDAPPATPFFSRFCIVARGRVRG